MLDPFVCTPLFLPSAARPHGNEAKNPDFFLTRCIFLPSFLTSCLLASILEIVVTQGCLGRPSDLRPCKLSLHTIKKKRVEAKNREKILSAKYSNELPEGRELHTFLGHVLRRPDIAVVVVAVVFFLLNAVKIISASLQPFMLGSFVF